MYWETKKFMTRLIGDTGFIAVVWNQTPNISEVCLWHPLNPHGSLMYASKRLREVEQGSKGTQLGLLPPSITLPPPPTKLRLTGGCTSLEARGGKRVSAE